MSQNKMTLLSLTTPSLQSMSSANFYATAELSSENVRNL